MNPHNTKLPPIGLMLKAADEAITRTTNQALQHHGLTRFHWQCLNTIHERNTIEADELYQEVHLFVDSTQFNQILSDFEQCGWLQRTNTILALTNTGETHYEQVIATQRIVRQQTIAGINDADYVTTIQVLQRIIDNLC